MCWKGWPIPFLVERAWSMAELLFLAGARFSLWPLVILQALMISYMILQVARAEAPRLTLGGLTAIGAVLSLFTGIGWYAGQVEPDIFTPVVILGAYLLLFRGDRLGRAGRLVVTGLTGLAVASHPSHLGLLGGLLIAAALFKLFQHIQAVPLWVKTDLKHGLIVLTTALSLIVAKAISR